MPKLKTQNEIVNIKQHPECKGEITFEKVSFNYNNEKKVIDNISFTIHPGESIAIMGKSGQGKSTLIKLILGLCKPQSGKVLLDQVNIEDIHSSSLRQQIGVVTQDQHLFDDTIAYNIAYGKPQTTLSQIIEVAKQSHLHEFIMSLPQQYHTLIGERGAKLSGGQKQRLCLARVLLKDPRIFIFDEVTSALDATTESNILSTLKEINKNRTTIFITHNQNLKKYVNRVICL